MFKRLIAFGVISFLIFWVLSVFVGGDAVNGKIEDGRYYFCSHGKYTEVSRTAYILSAGYIMILSATISLFMLLLFLLIVKGGITIKDVGSSFFSVIFPRAKSHVWHRIYRCFWTFQPLKKWVVFSVHFFGFRFNRRIPSRPVVESCHYFGSHSHDA